MTTKTRPKHKAPVKEKIITLPPQSYQPTKAQMEEEYDMPGASLGKLQRAFFRPVKVLREKK